MEPNTEQPKAPASTPDAKPDTKPDDKPKAKPDAKDDLKSPPLAELERNTARRRKASPKPRRQSG